jgi:hypothetical protein
MTKGYYCLIQFCPDFARAEAVNVGALVFRSEPASLAVRVIQESAAVVRRLQPRVRSMLVDEAVSGIDYRLRHANIQSVADLEQFVRTRGNQIQLTMPRSTRVEDPHEEVERLFAELVGAGPAAEEDHPRMADVADRLRRTFEALRARLPDRVEIGRRFQIPSVEMQIPTNYSYRNGRLNLVRIIKLPKTEATARREALALHSEGEIVRERLEKGAKLHVVSSPRGPRQVENEEVVANLLQKLDATEFVPSAKVEEFTQRVELEMAAH